MALNKIALVHWKLDEADEHVDRLVQAGYDVDMTLPNGPPYLRYLSDNPPAAVLIDLSRLPSQGRELAVSIRMRKATRHLPLVFIGGEDEKVDRVRQLLPDAVYTDWNHIVDVLEGMVEEGLYEAGAPVVPDTIFAAYSDTPIVTKLGIKEGASINLVNEPDNFVQLLGSLPLGVRFKRKDFSGCEMTIWFVRSLQDLEENIEMMAEALTRGSMWIAWNKKSSPLFKGLTQQIVREQGLAHNLVDYKICSIDEDWSALLFTYRK